MSKYDKRTAAADSSKPVKPRPLAAARPKKTNDSLDLSNTILTKTPSLSLLTNLHKLDLSNCGLTSLAFVAEAKGTLTWLNVSGNKLDQVGAWDGVETLSKLFVLNASHCGLKEVPSIVEALHSLKALVISYNSLTSLDHVKGLQNLNTIVASNNSLTSLPSALTSLPSLKKLSAAHNSLTPSSLPDLSLLSQLREIRLNDNPALSSLPSHFSSWGKGSLGDLEWKGKSTKVKGLEIVELGNCGFEDWSGLKGLAGQAGITSLGLKGNGVIEDVGDGVDAFEGFKSKITILLPALRILNNNRFDPKYFDLKAKRDLRPIEQVIVDAGPMARAANALSAKPVEVPALMVKKRRRNEEEVAAIEGAKEMSEEEKAAAKEVRRLERKKRRIEALAIENGEDVPVPVVEVVEKKERKPRKAKVESTTEEGTETKSKKRKNRHEPRADPIPSDSLATVESILNPPPAPIPIVVAIPVHPTLPLVRKRGRNASSLPSGTLSKPRKEEVPIVRKKKDARGVLSALLGGPDDQPELPVLSPAVEVVEEKEKVKVKTSVLKVVEMKRQDKRGGDVGSLLGLGSKKEVVEETGFVAWD